MAIVVYCFLLSLVAVGTHGFHINVHPSDPSNHPDYSRYNVKHPTLSTFENTTLFATYRGFQIDDTYQIINYSEDLNKFCLNSSTTLGNVIWPMYPMLYTNNFNDVVSNIKQRGLFVTDIWAFVPGSGPGIGSQWKANVWQQFYPPKDKIEFLENTLGDHWLGMDIGEQDGRYIGGFANQQVPLNLNRKEQYLNFRKHFGGMEDILGPKVVSLNSLTFSHYMAKTGHYTMLGAETGQALPNAQIFYSFIRGAGKQYGVLWFGNVSVYNRFGYKTYISTKGTTKSSEKPRTYTCNGQGAPQCGTSLNLMKRLMFAQIMYGSSYVSFENSWFYGNTDRLSPIGTIQHTAKQFMEKYKSFGAHITTVGLLLDFYAGWCPPRHLYSGNLYRVWGNLPYSEGDYLTDGLLRMIYPNYQDSSYFHDETGFSSPTPYGDATDVLLSDSPLWLLNQYSTIVLAGSVESSQELKDNLEAYVIHGGNLVTTVNNLLALPDGILGITGSTHCNNVPSGTKVMFLGGQSIMESKNMTVCNVSYPQNASILAHTSNGPLIIQVALGSSRGTVTVFVTPYSLSSSQVCQPANTVDKTLCTPYPLLDHATIVYDEIFHNATLFSSANLTLTTTAADDIGKEFYVLVTNPLLEQQPMKITTPTATIESMNEIELDQSEKGMVGYLPDGYEDSNLGNSTPTTIAGGDTRLYRIVLSKPVEIIDYYPLRSALTK